MPTAAKFRASWVRRAMLMAAKFRASWVRRAMPTAAKFKASWENMIPASQQNLQIIYDFAYVNNNMLKVN